MANFPDASRGSEIFVVAIEMPAIAARLLKIVAITDQKKCGAAHITQSQPGFGGDLRSYACGLSAGESNGSGILCGLPHRSRLRVGRVFVLDQSRLAHDFHVFVLGSIVLLI